MIVVVFEVHEMETCKGVIIFHLNTETKVKLLQVRKKEVRNSYITCFRMILSWRMEYL